VASPAKQGGGNEMKTINIKMDGPYEGDEYTDEAIPLHEYLTDEESLSPEEMYALNTLAVGEKFEMGVHYGFVTFIRIT
jgi:hypothetical protein